MYSALNYNYLIDVGTNINTQIKILQKKICANIHRSNIFK